MKKDKIIHNMCFTWRHDYGLLDEKEKTFLFNQMKQVFENNIENELVTQGEVDDYIERIELLEEKLEEAMKPKTCNGCKNYSNDNSHKAWECIKAHKFVMCGHAFEPPKDFCCSLFELKDNE